MLFSSSSSIRKAAARRSGAIRQAAQIEALETRTLLSTWYVSTAGADTAAGSLTAPLKTIQAAINKAASGDTITIRGGTYAQALSITKPGLTIQSYTGETARIAVSYTNSAIEVAIRIGEDANNTRLINLDISGGYYYALKTESTWDTGASNPHGPSNLFISGSKLHDSGRDVIKLTPKTDYSIIEKSEIYNSGRRDGSNAEGIDAVQANYAILRDSIIHDTTTNGIYYKGGSVNTIIERNKVYNTAHSGILLGQSSDANWFDVSVNPYYYESIGGIVRDNIVYNTQGAGIGAWAAQNAQIYNNTLVNVAQSMFGGLLIQGQEAWPDRGPLAGQYVFVPSNNVTVYNNIVQMSSSRPVLNIRTDGLSGTLTLSNNEYYNSGSGAISDDVHSYYGGLSGWQSRGYDANSFWATAQLDATNGNYKLTGSSPAIDKGRTAPISYDYGMSARPYGAAFDIGAWEYGSSTTVTPPPVTPPPPTPEPTYTPKWTNSAFANQTGSFTAEWDATPKMAKQDMTMGLSSGTATSVANLAAIVRFNDQGYIDARNRGAYTAMASVGYSANSKYHIKMVVNLAAHTYDVYVTDAAGRTTQIARGYGFRTEQSNVKQLNNRGTYNFTGDATLTSTAISTAVAPTTSRNLAIGATATASGQESSSTSASYAIDGNTSTRWASGGWDTMSQAKWIQVDLGAVRTITGVNILWEWAAARGYQIQVSSDGTNWTTAATVTDGAQGWKNTTLSATGRYVRIYCTTAATAWGYSMYELQIMGY